MMICAKMGFNQLDFEGDYKTLITSVNSKEDCLFELRSIIQDIQALLHCQPDWKVSFTYREANATAHHLAKFACTTQNDHIWMEKCLEIVMQYALLDKNVFTL